MWVLSPFFLTVALLSPGVLVRECFSLYRERNPPARISRNSLQILELAAALDRLDRAEGSVAGDVRLTRVREALELLLESRAIAPSKCRLTFSRPYDSAWQTTLAVKER